MLDVLGFYTETQVGQPGAQDTEKFMTLRKKGVSGRLAMPIFDHILTPISPIVVFVLQARLRPAPRSRPSLTR